MAREEYIKTLDEIKQDVLVLGSMVEHALLESVRCLKAQDEECARKIYFGDRAINQKRFDIEDKTITTIATQGPMAGDLRFLAAVLEIITELERMGDYAKSISRITITTADEPFFKPLIDLPRMGEIGANMLHRAMVAFSESDAVNAKSITVMDTDVDWLFQQVQREILTYTMANPKIMDKAKSLLWAADKLERFADRACNICERTIYMVTGENIETDQDAEEEKLLRNR